MNDMSVPAIHEAARIGDRAVRHFRQVLLWPLQLVVDARPGRARAPLGLLGSDSRWSEVIDEYTGGSEALRRAPLQRVRQLPAVRAALSLRRGASPARRQRPGDRLADARLSPPRHRRGARRAAPGDEPITLQIVHVDLYFFYGVDVALLNVEVAADDLPLALAQELMYRFGRAYPAGWGADGQPCTAWRGVEWLDASGNVLARSDAQERATFLSHWRSIARRASPALGIHARAAGHPPFGADGPLHFRQIEYHRMPMMAYLAMDAPRSLTRATSSASAS